MERDLKKVQEELLVLIKIFHSFCVSNNIQYSIHGGTMLGAVREKGFISWDDDIDITFTRKEYDRFKKCSKKMNDCIVLKTDGLYPRLIMKRVNAPVVWLDIFIYDYISNNIIMQKCKIAMLKVMNLMFRDSNTLVFSKKRSGNNWIRYIFIVFCVKVGKAVDRNKLLNIANMIMKSCKGDKSLIHRSNDTVAGMPMILPSYVMSSYTNIKFEDTELMITKYWNEVLLSSYGKDYMTPRKTVVSVNHTAFVNSEVEEAEQFLRSYKQ